jgi:hypothetical protein
MVTKIRLSRSFKTRVEPTPLVVQCAGMFGIGVDEDIDITLYSGLQVTLGEGRVIYITGDSGAGKSCLLRDIVSHKETNAKFRVVSDRDIEDMPDKPLVDQFGDMPLIKIGELLAFVGISEAFVYLRKPKELSDGQRYRFKLAMMIYESIKETEDKRTPLITVDEYLAFLDRETAKNVAYQTRRASSKYGFCVVVATTHADIAEDLQANLTIKLQMNMPAEIKNTALAGD